MISSAIATFCPSPIFWLPPNISDKSMPVIISINESKLTSSQATTIKRIVMVSYTCLRHHSEAKLVHKRSIMTAWLPCQGLCFIIFKLLPRQQLHDEAASQKGILTYQNRR